MTTVVSHKVLTTDPIVIEFDLSTGVRLRAMLDCGYPFDSDYTQEQIAGAIQFCERDTARSVAFWLACWQFQLLQSTAIDVDPYAAIYKRAIELWNTDWGSWAEIADEVGETPGRTFTESVKKYAKRIDEPLREGRAGRKKQ